MAEAVDAIVIGAGQAGPFLAAKLAENGWNVVLIERSRLGGTCVNDGCTPTKTLVASARAAWMARRAADYGVTVVGPVTVDMRAVKSRKDAVVGASVQSLTAWLAGLESLEVIYGSARFLSPSTVQVGERIFSAPKIFLNVGARASIPDWPGLADVNYLTNTTVMDLDFLPPHLLIAGGSYIGLEFAQIYARFGSKVTVVERTQRIAAREDMEISQTLREMLEAEGVSFHLESEILSVEKVGADIRLSIEGPTGPATLEGSHFLIALGRTPNTDDLGLAAAGLKTDARGFIPVDDQLRTEVSGIWALGDVNGRGAFTHTSYNDFEVVAGNLLNGAQRSIAGRIPVYGLFTDPPLGRIGMTEAEVRRTGRKALVASYPMARVGRARERGETTGVMKAFVDAETSLILGAAILGINGDEVVHSLLQLMAAGTPYETMLETVHIHPTVSELVPTLLSGLRPLE